MAGNRSLDEFVTGGEPAESGDDRPAVDEGGDVVPASDSDGPAAAAGTPGEASAIEPKPETYRWTPDGATCASCGSTVEARWRDGDAFVCVDCKAW